MTAVWSGRKVQSGRPGRPDVRADGRAAGEASVNRATGDLDIRDAAESVSQVCVVVEAGIAGNKTCWTGHGVTKAGADPAREVRGAATAPALTRARSVGPRPHYERGSSLAEPPRVCGAGRVAVGELHAARQAGRLSLLEDASCRLHRGRGSKTQCRQTGLLAPPAHLSRQLLQLHRRRRWSVGRWHWSSGLAWCGLRDFRPRPHARTGPS